MEGGKPREHLRAPYCERFAETEDPVMKENHANDNTDKKPASIVH